MSLEIRFALPNQPRQIVPIDRPRMLIGTLLSNEVILRSPGIEPIHAMIEEDDNGEQIIVDLGSGTGVKVNGSPIDVEHKLNDGDVVEIGDISLDIKTHIEQPTTEDYATIPKALPKTEVSTRNKDKSLSETLQASKTIEPPISDIPKSAEPSTTVRYEKKDDENGKRKELLFSPRKAKPSGDVLEVVSYWGNTILDVELFHPDYKGFEACTIGDPTKAHFLAGGKKSISKHLFATFSSEGYKIRLLDGMKARIRKGGKVGQKEGPSKMALGRRDIAHVTHGSIAYFLMFIKPPNVILPPNRSKDPFFLGILTAAMLFYFLTVPVLWLSTPKEKVNKMDDAWTIVNVPEKPKPEEKAKPRTPKPVVKPKPQVKVAQKKVKPKLKPPKPKPPKVTPKKPMVKPKPKPKPQKTNVKVAKTTTKNKATNSLPKKRSRVKQLLSQLKSKPGEGMASSGARRPDFKMPGPRTNIRSSRSGGAKGSGMGQRGGGRKGRGKTSVMGVHGVKNNKASGVNLSKLGLGAGKILKRAGAGAIRTKFSNSAGGAGGGSGHMNKTYGLGGMGSGSSLGIAGTGSAINNFGSGSGGSGSGAGGRGGLGGAGLGRGFGKKGSGAGGRGGGGRANVVVPPGDPIVSGGLTSQEVQAVIRANLNQIRHCYEQLLQRSPRANGKIKVSFVVSPGGRVSSASIVSSSLNDSMMKGCVTGKIRRWKFPRPRGGKAVTVKYPFVFNPL